MHKVFHIFLHTAILHSQEHFPACGYFAFALKVKASLVLILCGTPKMDHG